MKKLLLLISLMFSTIVLSQTTYTVDNKPNAKADFDNLQTAINTVSAGSTLLVQGSSASYGEIKINKKITIIGPGYFLDENPNTQVYKSSVKIDDVLFDEGASNSSINGLDFEPEHGIRFLKPASNISILNNHVGFIYGSLSCTNIIVKNNYIFYRFSYSFNVGSNSVYLGAGSVVTGNYVAGFVHGEHLTVTNNICYLKGASTGYAVKSSNIYNNIILKAANNYVSFISDVFENSLYNNIIIRDPGSSTDIDNNLVIDTSIELFIDNTNSRYSSDGKYILASGSPAKGAGVGGVDCGMFFEENDVDVGYKLSGLPNIPSIYEFNVPTTGYSNSSGLQINVKVKSNN